MLPRRAIPFLYLFLTPSLALAQSSLSADPASLPARDVHEGLLVAADSYHHVARSKSKFGKKHPQGAGLLALDVYFRNDTDQPIRITLDRILLLIEPPGERRQRLEFLSVEEVVDRLAGKDAPAPSVPRTRLPLPRSDRNKDWQRVEQTVSPLALQLGLVPPHVTVHGFLFFDLDSHWELLSHARLYIPEVKAFGGKQLLFFEVDLAPALK